MQPYWERLFSQDTGYYLLLVVLAILTQHIVSWAGSVLSSVGSEEYHYAVFTFKDDRPLPMTTNILMNVCIPNVFMVFLFMASKKLGVEGAEHRLLLYVVAFFVYRMILICVLLRRKEMYHWPYELAMAVAGISLAYWLCRSFFVTEKTVFLEISELREELWIAILLVLYQFLKMILDKKVTQNTVLTKGQITRYITRKFDRFFQRYGELLEITTQNRYLCVFLFAVMIFEDYNRGPIVRRIERIKAHFCKQTTTGIMQMRGDDGPLSDQESVLLFYRWLEQTAVDDAQFALGDDVVRNLAWQHNNDDNYANSVAYIYEKLCNYIDEVPRYREYFLLREGCAATAETVETAETAEAAATAGIAETERMPPPTFSAETPKRSMPFSSTPFSSMPFSVTEEHGEVCFQNMSCVRLVGDELRSVFDHAAVLRIRSCTEVWLSGLADNPVAEHVDGTVTERMEYADGVAADMRCRPMGVLPAGARLYFEGCQTVELRNLDMSAGGCEIFAIDSCVVTRDCQLNNCRIRAAGWGSCGDA